MSDFSIDASIERSIKRSIKRSTKRSIERSIDASITSLNSKENNFMNNNFQNKKNCDGFISESHKAQGEYFSVSLDRKDYSGINAESEMICQIEFFIGGCKYSYQAKTVELFIVPNIKLKLCFYRDYSLIKELAAMCDEALTLTVYSDAHFEDSRGMTNHAMKMTELSDCQTDINKNKSLHYVGEEYIYLTLEAA